MAHGKSSYDPRDAQDFSGSFEPAQIPVVSRTFDDSQQRRERRDRLDAEALRQTEVRRRKAAQQVQDALADRMRQRPLASSSSAFAKPVPMWKTQEANSAGSGYDHMPEWARPKPSVRMPRSMGIQPLYSRPISQPVAPPPVPKRMVEKPAPSAPQPTAVPLAAALPTEPSHKEPEKVPMEPSLASSKVYPERGRGRRGFSSWKDDADKLPYRPPSRQLQIDKVPAPEPVKPWKPDTSRKEIRQLLAGEIELEDLPKELLGDRDIVRAALQVDGHALQHASEELKRDRTVVQAAVRENGLALSHASAEACEDREIVLTAVQQNGVALQHASRELQRDHPLVLEALASDPEAARFVARELLDDRDFVISAAPFARRVFEKASFRLKRDKDVVLEVIEQDPEAFMFAAWELRCDRSMVLAAVSTSGCAIAHASPELRQDPEILAVAIANDPMARAAARG